MSRSGPASGPSADRQLAAGVLLRQLERAGRVDLWLAQAQDVSPVDRRRAWALVYGVLRSKTLLEAQLAPFLKKPMARQPRAVQVALYLGAYELSSMDAVPDRAAVHQAVELCRRLGKPGASGFVNAVLRRLSRRESPVTLPGREEQPRAWAEQVASHPRWIVDSMVDRVGPVEAASWCDTNNSKPPVHLRFAAAEVPEDLDLQPLELIDGAYHLGSEQGPVGSLPGFTEGRFWVQDGAAQAVGLMLGLKPGMKVLDACAAPGGKTLAAAREVGSQGQVVAIDRSDDRLDLLRNSLQRTGFSAVEVQQRDLLRQPWGSLERDPCFDAVLLDAPCTGLGVIRRHPEVRWARSAGDPKSSHCNQLKLLRSLVPALAAGGALVYSVCSFTRQETDDVIEAFLSAESDFELVDPRPLVPASMEPLLDGRVLRTYPHRHNLDAFFAARLERRS